jgi:hypothetical protein
VLMDTLCSVSLTEVLPPEAPKPKGIPKIATIRSTDGRSGKALAQGWRILVEIDDRLAEVARWRCYLGKHSLCCEAV